MLSGSGLEINLVMSDPKNCFMRPPVSGTATTANAFQRLTADTYSIDNIFLGLCYHETINPQLSLHYELPFTSVY